MSSTSMPSKRKQADVEPTTNSLPPNPAKKVKLSLPEPSKPTLKMTEKIKLRSHSLPRARPEAINKVKPSSQDSSKATSCQTSEKVKLRSQDTPKATTLKKRKTSDDVSDPVPTYHNPAKKAKLSSVSTKKVTSKDVTKSATTPLPTTFSTAKSTLIPRGNRAKATLGQQDDSLLRVLCDDSKTGEAKELHFRKIPHSMVDWNKPQHIKDINSWRNQIYGRAGVKSKQVTMWHEEEELWFELYFHLSIAESRSRGMLLPKTKEVLDAFNKTFVGCVLTDKEGNELEARAERQLNAFASKFNRMCPELKARLNQSVFGKSGDIFLPKITNGMLEEYRQMRSEMAAQGITEESEYSDNIEVWQTFLSHLPSSSDGEAQEDTLLSEEDSEAAATLVSMANAG
ncbi:hypothetical protein N0V83_004479 [Neocucurbitaria cava]|uniref:Uncharacterized protein n=1 Tax=Neocucurbitaria cava TaxID=798079 RepID=A0A9W8Y998_9PLEO|nr:hypothetical protein N0V83_004479 [Neocucurbitaria cava]